MRCALPKRIWGVELPDGHPPRISVNHILVKHVAAKRVPQSVARTREEARLRALSCPLLLLRRLRCNVVETPSGFHIILRTE